MWSVGSVFSRRRGKVKKRKQSFCGGDKASYGRRLIRRGLRKSFPRRQPSTLSRRMPTIGRLIEVSGKKEEVHGLMSATQWQMNRLKKKTEGQNLP